MIGKKIEQRRKELGLTMKELGDRIGTTKQYINDIEKENINASFKRLKRISDALGCDIDIQLTPNKKP